MQEEVADADPPTELPLPVPETTEKEGWLLKKNQRSVHRDILSRVPLCDCKEDAFDFGPSWCTV